MHFDSYQIIFYSFIFSGLPEYKRHMSVPADLAKGNKDGIVMQKVASLTLNKAELESKISKPKFVPEKLDFELYEKFEGEQFNLLIHVLLGVTFK